MIPIEKLRQVTVIYTHAKCPDGMASAMILKDAFRMLGVNPLIEFLVHDTVEHEIASSIEWPRTVEWKDGFALFCDICPLAPHSNPDVVRRTIVLDHHKGTRDIVEAFGENGVYADAETEPGVSGATLAFREVWMVAQAHREDARQDSGTAPIVMRSVQDFAECSGVRDCWVTSDQRFLRGQHIAKMLMSKPASHWLVPRNVGMPNAPYLDDEEISNGEALFEMHLETVRQAVDQCVIYDIAEQVVLYVFQEQACGHRLTSDVAEATRVRLKEQGSDHLGVVAGFAYVVDNPGDTPKLSWSLRGLNGFDVQKFAYNNGGNGHAAAAGFSYPVGGSLPRAMPYTQICLLLEEHLSRPDTHILERPKVQA